MRRYSHLSDDERADWFGQNFRPFDWRDRAGDQPSEIDDRRHITVLFCDLVGSTSISASPEAGGQEGPS